MAISYAIQGDILDTWRQIVFEDIWRFNQVVGLGVKDNAAGDDDQQAYLSKDRDTVARALQTVVKNMKNRLNYNPYPTWEVGEFHRVNPRIDIRGQLFTTRWGHLIEFGKRATTVIEAGSDVTYSNAQGLGVDDTASVTVTTTVADDEIGLFFQVADGANTAASAQYRILPVTVTDNGDGTKTISGHRAMFVKPSAIWDKPYENGTNPEPNYADTQTSADFVTDVDVYRVYADATQAIELHTPRYCNNCSDTVTYRTAVVEDNELGMFRICDDECPNYGNRIRVWYRAGYAKSNGELDPELARAMVRYANAEMSLSPGGLLDAAGVWEDDRRMEDQTSQLIADDLGQYFGVLRGQMAAARVVTMRGIARGGWL